MKVSLISETRSNSLGAGLLPVPVVDFSNGYEDDMEPEVPVKEQPEPVTTRMDTLESIEAMAFASAECHSAEQSSPSAKEKETCHVSENKNVALYSVREEYRDCPESSKQPLLVLPGQLPDNTESRLS